VERQRHPDWEGYYEENSRVRSKSAATADMMCLPLAHVDSTYSGAHQYPEQAALSPVEIARLL
jgi:hypothetical protein